MKPDTVSVLNIAALFQAVSRQLAVATGLALLVVLLTGCPDNGPSEPADDAAINSQTDTVEPPADADDAATDGATPPVVEDKPDPAVVWAETAAKIEEQLAAKEFDQAKAAVADLTAIYQSPDQPTGEQLAQLEGFNNALKAEEERLAAALRAENIAAGEELMNRGKFEEAVRALNDVLARAPTDEERKRVGVLAAEVERRRRARRDLISWMQLLESSDRREIATAQSQLSRDVDTAVSLLIEASEKTDKPVLVRNALETLRIMNRPDVSVPAMLAVLKRSEQHENWPDVISELGKFTVPGAGEPLLNLALEAEEPAQRSAVLVALAQVEDPPQETLVKLMPVIAGDQADLTAALTAARRAADVHGQHDLVSRRGFDISLSPEGDQALETLPNRISEIASGKDEAAAEAARLLAHTIGLAESQPLEGVKIARAHAEAEDGLATAALDGVWNSIELPSMWRYPIDKQSLIEFDLGESKIVTGVKIWNFNQPSYTQRGWKEVDVYVGDSSARMSLVATGIVPPAPGIADPPDYGTIVPVQFARGRFVRLVAKSTWTRDTHTGLAEVQVLGMGEVGGKD